MGRNRGRARGGRRKDWKSSNITWIGGGVLLLGLLLIPTLDLGAASHHPEPREHVDHTHVAPAARYAAYPRVASIYQEVAEVPHVIDGIYCYCACSEHSGHHSLLDCFHDDHAARCDVCLSEGTMAYRMHKDGKSLEEIRTAIDRLYET
jgi:hypothetical protein